jgi:DNA-binding CsgD family transcriptional regulator
MKPELQSLHDVWFDAKNKASESTNLPKIAFEDLASAVVSTGPFFYYVIDFYDMSVSDVSQGIDSFGFDPAKVTFNEILSAIHPEDLPFIAKAEEAIGNFFYKNVGRDKLLSYKANYNFRGKLKDGSYVLVNHQALMLTLDRNGGYGKALNIITRIDHLTKQNTYQYSLIGLNNEPSYMNLNVDDEFDGSLSFSKREIDIIKNIADGLSNDEIADKLFISALTVKKHRTNILRKSESKNTAQLVKNCILQGVI